MIKPASEEEKVTNEHLHVGINIQAKLGPSITEEETVTEEETSAEEETVTEEETLTSWALC